MKNRSTEFVILNQIVTHITILNKVRPNLAFLDESYYSNTPSSHDIIAGNYISNYLRSLYSSDSFKFMLYMETGSLSTWKRQEDGYYLLYVVRRIVPKFSNNCLNFDFIPDKQLLREALGC